MCSQLSYAGLPYTTLFSTQTQPKLLLVDYSEVNYDWLSWYLISVLVHGGSILSAQDEAYAHDADPQKKVCEVLVLQSISNQLEWELATKIRWMCVNSVHRQCWKRESLLCRAWTGRMHRGQKGNRLPYKTWDQASLFWSCPKWFDFWGILTMNRL